ncbi:hypothetical protein K469DRAFT_756512 [Zopfia rhizophila CBS 207.26]|uniref:C2H2-type domain-containing protein n=1 Tax=Zopfia rhizophila CBS 207.26 TaxID=1314779 RepID=A0A6A6D6C3_9PEZI|nr:hypothetical protein K469DRAFT_756512 [Zopfia rhizophila CBS 207.26]
MTDAMTESLESLEEPRWLTRRLRDQTPQLLEKLNRLSDGPIDCPLMEIGEFVLRRFDIIVQFAEDIIASTTIQDYIENMAPRLADLDDGSMTKYLDDKQEVLSSMIEGLRVAVDSCRDSWLKSPRPPPSRDKLYRAMDHIHVGHDVSCNQPSAETGSRVRLRSVLPHRQDPSRRPLTNGLHPKLSLFDNSPESERNEIGYAREYSGGLNCFEGNSDEDEEDEFENDLGIEHLFLSDSELSRRGTGDYKCPLKTNCTKGGVVDGKLKSFKRNSEYRAHRDRHLKPYKCDLTGCSNKKGFGRKDQLDRHKQQAKHKDTHHPVQFFNSSQAS